MNAIELIKSDHKKLLANLEQLEKKPDQELFETIIKQLEKHETMEEKELYPTLKGTEETKDLALEAYQEHQLVDKLVRELEKLSFGSDVWAAKFKVMKENIEHHITEEEQALLPKATQVIDKSDLNKIGKEMEEIQKS